MKTLFALIFTASLYAQLPQVAVPTQQLTGVGQAVVAVLEGTAYTSVGIQITGTWSATVQFESSVDCTTWATLTTFGFPGVGLNDVTSATANGQWVTNTPGLCAIRARMSAYTSGTAVAVLRPSSGSFASPSTINVAAADGSSNGGALTTKYLGGNGFPLIYPMIYNGATWDRSFYCNLTATVSVTAAATTQIIALSGTTKIRVCSFSVSMSAAGTAQWIQGTGANCGSTTANLTAATTLATGTPWTVAAGQGAVFTGTAGNALCLAAVTGNVVGFVTYAQY